MGTFTGHPPADHRRPLLAAHFLGTFQVTIDGVLVDTTSRRRTRHVLAYPLAHRRAPVPRDVLIEALWPGTAPAAARNSLHVALSHVRQALRAAHPQAAIERRFDTYRIAALLWTALRVRPSSRTTALFEELSHPRHDRVTKVA